MVDVNNYPSVPIEFRPRGLYFEHLDSDSVKNLEGKGYEVIMLCTLPRNTTYEELYYLRCKARGIEEGTVKVSEQQSGMLKLLFKSAGLLDENRGGRSEDKSSVKRMSEIEDLLKDFDVSRHTVDSSTIGLTKEEMDDKD